MARPDTEEHGRRDAREAAGSVMEVIDCQSVAPRASDPSFITLRTLVSASSATETTVGNAISPTTMPTNRYVDPPLSANAPPAHGLITVKPMKP